MSCEPRLVDAALQSLQSSYRKQRACARATRTSLVAVIVVLRARFKDSKNGWVAHVKRAALHARSALGDIEYTAHKAALASAMS